MKQKRFRRYPKGTQATPIVFPLFLQANIIILVSGKQLKLCEYKYV